MNLRPGFKLRRRRKPKSLRSRGSALSFELVESIFELYCGEYSAREIAEKTGVSAPTIAKYISEGDGSRGIAPLKVRRDAIISALQRKHDDAIIASAVRASSVAADTAEVIGARVISRVKNAPILEDPDLYRGDDKAMELAAREKAYNPQPKDLKVILDATANLERAKNRPTTTLNVSQSQEQAVQVAVAEEIDFVRDNVQNIQRSMGQAEREAIAKLVQGVSLHSESHKATKSAEASIVGGNAELFGED